MSNWHVIGHSLGNLKTPRNMKYLMTAAALCLGMMTAKAQTEQTAPMAPATHNCLASTTDKDWASLDLTAEQKTKVKNIKEECMKASDKMKADNTDTKTSPMMDKYESEVKAVLTPAQYDKWVKWCSTRADKKMDDKKSMEKSN